MSITAVPDIPPVTTRSSVDYPPAVAADGMGWITGGRIMTRQSRRTFIARGIRLAAGGMVCGSLPTACHHDKAPTDKTVFRSTAADIDPDFTPGYVKMRREGELARRADELWAMMSACRLCPRRCGRDRIGGEPGFCGASARLQVASYHPHLGEEACLVGRNGSGTVFFTHCGLRCVFCINWPISQGDQGQTTSTDKLAEMMLALQDQGCHNINVVTPTHYLPHILKALDRAADNGLRLPLVYNTCGWEQPDILAYLDGIVDIYLPDFKYADPKMAARYSSGAATYPDITGTALLEMHRQVGTAHPSPDGIMYRGLMIRHLVMPNNVGGTREVIRWVATHLPRDTYFNLMSQYRPVFRAREFPDIARPITRAEYVRAVAWAREAGLTNLDIQGYPRL